MLIWQSDSHPVIVGNKFKKRYGPSADVSFVEVKESRKVNPVCGFSGRPDTSLQNRAEMLGSTGPIYLSKYAHGQNIGYLNLHLVPGFRTHMPPKCIK